MQGQTPSHDQRARLLCPPTRSWPEAQVHGGMSMSIGYGSEQLLFDPKTGRPLNNNSFDYKLSTTMDHCDLKAESKTLSPPALWHKALGEPPPAPVPPPSATRSSTQRALP
ncbi:MAG: hypothetical protein R2912_04220 [Eubacteriales bacterium]